MKKNILLCGTTGWIIEILFTSFQSFRRRQKKLYATTSLWMFPIYGFAAFFLPLMKCLKKYPIFLRGLFYMLGIFLTEYTSGRLLGYFECCPWNYEKSRFHFKKVIRLDYAPLWFVTGLFLEHLLFSSEIDS